jgi:hypothetical protein
MESMVAGRDHKGICEEAILAVQQKLLLLAGHAAHSCQADLAVAVQLVLSEVVWVVGMGMWVRLGMMIGMCMGMGLLGMLLMRQSLSLGLWVPRRLCLRLLQVLRVRWVQVQPMCRHRLLVHHGSHVVVLLHVLLMVLLMVLLHVLLSVEQVLAQSLQLRCHQSISGVAKAGHAVMCTGPQWVKGLCIPLLGNLTIQLVKGIFAGPVSHHSHFTHSRCRALRHRQVACVL